MVGPTKVSIELEFVYRCCIHPVLKNEDGETISVFDLQKQP